MSVTPYDLLADEYYEERHKTCRNFDAATKAAISAYSPNIADAGLVLEVGCGRGRTHEFLAIPHERTVQLDSSVRMLALGARERCLLQVLADATSIPLAPGQFAAVVGFLVDPFLGLNFLSEAYRLLIPGGVLFFTTPAFEWANALRGQSGDGLEARFVTSSNSSVTVPSYVIPRTQTNEMLRHCGFREISTYTQALPSGTSPISSDIENAAMKSKRKVHDLPILDLVRAVKPI